MRNENVANTIKVEAARKAVEQVVAKAVASAVGGSNIRPSTPSQMLENASKRLVRDSELLEQNRTAILGKNGAVELLASAEVEAEKFYE